MRFVFFISILLFAFTGHANHYFRSTGQFAGLDVDIVLDVTFDNDGVMWIASREGLYRYDSASTEQVTTVDGLTDSDIRKVVLGPKNRLWVATNSGGLNIYDVDTGDVQVYQAGGNTVHSLTNNSVYDVAFTQKYAWVATQNGLNRLNLESGEIKQYFANNREIGQLSHNYIYELMVDTHGRIWISTVGGGVSRYDEKNQTFTNITLSEFGYFTEANDVFSVEQIATDRFIFATRKGLFLFNDRTQELTQLGTEQAFEEGVIDTIQVDGVVYLATLTQGVLAYDIAEQNIFALNDTPVGTVSNLPSVPALSLGVYQSQLFVGTWGRGLFATPIGYHNLDAKLMRSSVMGDNANLTSVLEYDNKVVGGSFGAGLLFLGTNAKLQRSMQNPAIAWQKQWDSALLKYPELARAGILSAAYLDNKNELVLGTTQGLWLLNLNTLALIKYSEVHEQPIGYVNAIAVQDNGDIWFGSGGNGLMQLPANRDYVLMFNSDNQAQHNLSGHYVSALQQQGSQVLWVGTRSNGMNRCTLRPLKCESINDLSHSKSHYNVTDIVRVADQSIVFSTRGGGVYEYQAQSKMLKQFSTANGLASDVALAVLEDDDQSLWISTSEGVSRVSADRTRIYNYPIQAMLGVSQFNAHSKSQTENHLYFGALEGLVRFNKNTPIPHYQEYELLTKVSVTDDEQELAANQAHYDISPLGIVKLNFTLLDYADKKIQFEYRLHDAEPWQSTGVGQQLLLYHMPAGQYQVSIRGRDHAGKWQQSETITITVYPFFWQTAWFQLAVLVLSLVFFWWLHTVRTRRLFEHNQQLQRLQKQKERAFDTLASQQQELKQTYRSLRHLTERLQQAKEQERAHISRELHDEIGQNLTACKLNLQMALGVESQEKNEKISSSVQLLNKIIGQTRDVSRSLRPPQLDELGVLVALQSFIDDTQKLTGITINTDWQHTCAQQLKPFNALIFRLVQESVHNALKHAHATTINIRIHCEQSEIMITIKDDGMGIAQPELEQRMRSGNHLGLLGMRERLVHINGELTVNSELSKGCTIKARIPYEKNN